MSTIYRNSVSKYFLFLLLAMWLAPGVLSAQDYKGTFTVPFELKWGRATLPAGEYSLKLDTAVAPNIVTVRGEGSNAMIMTNGVSDRDASGGDCLIVVRRGRTGRVRALRLSIPTSGKPNDGLVFSYSAPPNEPQLLAQGPELIQRIPIVAAGK